MLNIPPLLLTTVVSVKLLPYAIERQERYPNFSRGLAIGVPLAANLGAYLFTAAAISPFALVIATVAQIIFSLRVLHWMATRAEEEADALHQETKEGASRNLAGTEEGADVAHRDNLPEIYGSHVTNGRLPNFDEGHEYEDCASVDRGGADFTLLTLLDGHGGKEAADFVADALPTRILSRAQINSPKQALRDSYLEVDDLFWSKHKPAIDKMHEYDGFKAEFVERNGLTGVDAVDWSLAENAVFREAFHAFMDIEREQSAAQVRGHMQAIGKAVPKSGTTAATVLIDSSGDEIKATAANVGDTAIIVIRANDQMEQLYTEHSVRNRDEHARLKGLYPAINLSHGRVGTGENTRSFGDYANSVGYKDTDSLAAARGRPIIAEPAVSKTVTLEAGDRIVLATDGIYNAIVQMREVQGKDTWLGAVFKELRDRINGLESEEKSLAEQIRTDYLKEGHRVGDEGKQKLRKLDDMTALVYTVPRLVTVDDLDEPELVEA